MGNSAAINWLLEGEPWVKYITRTILLDQPKESYKILVEEIIKNPQIQKIIKELKQWPGKPLSNHKSASQYFHKLSLLADFGLTKANKDIDEICQKVMGNVSDQDLFLINTNVPVHYGGTGKDELAWSLCDAPLILYSLLKFGYRNETIIKGVKYIMSLIRDNGWPCKVSENLGKFRGPGRKDDPCPFATLASLKMLTQLDEYKNSKEAMIGVETLLKLWANSRTLHPYMFYMGTDFRKLKAPLFWYEILNVVNVLSEFDYARKDRRLLEMLDVIKYKANSEGKYISESVYREFSDFDFGQKKIPSRWLTLNVLEIIKKFDSKK